MVKSQPVLPLRAMQQQGSVAMHVAMQMSLVWAATWDRADVQGMCRAGPIPHQLQHSGEQALHLTWTEL